MTRPLLLTTAVAAALLAGAAGAQGRDPMGGGFDIMSADADEDGRITREELEAQAQARFDEADADGDGALSPDEMVAAAEARRIAALTARMTGMVERMDDDGDGLLQYSEIEARTPRIAPMFDRLDQDGDGAIDESELAEMRDRRGDHHEHHGGRFDRHGGRGDHGSRWGGMMRGMFGGHGAAADEAGTDDTTGSDAAEQ